MITAYGKGVTFVDGRRTKKRRSDLCQHVAPEIIKLIRDLYDTTPFMAINGSLRKCKDMFGRKNIKIIRKAAFDDKLLLPHFLQR